MLQPDSSSPSLLSIYLAEFEPRKLIDKTQSTRDGYRRNIRRFGELLGREATTDDLQDELVEWYMRSLIARGKTPGTARKCRSQLVAFWGWAARKGYAKTFPDVPTVREHRHVPTTWESDDWDMIVTSALECRGRVGRIRSSAWWHALLLTEYDSGLRPGALLQLPRRAVNFRRQLLIVEPETQKTGKGQQFKLAADTLAAIQVTISQHPRRDLLFPWPKHRSTLYNAYKRILRRAGLDHDRRSMFGRLRRTTLTMLKRAGGDPTEFAAHSSPEVTMRYLGVERTVHPADVFPRPRVRKNRNLAG